MSHVANIIRDANRLKAMSDQQERRTTRRMTKAIADEVSSIPDKLNCRDRYEDYSFYLFSPDGRFRQGCHWLAENKWFDNFILFLIGVSSITMLIEKPLDNPNEMKFIVVNNLNKTITIIFTVELLVKCIAWGAMFGEGAYTSSGWNNLDGFVVLISLIDLLPLGGAIPGVKTLRVLRALRPLRVISRNENLKVVINTLLKSLPELCNLLVVAFLFFLIFGLISVTYFKGTFYTCQMPDGGDLGEFEMDLGATVNGVVPNCIDVNASSATFGHIWPQGVAED